MGFAYFENLCAFAVEFCAVVMVHSLARVCGCSINFWSELCVTKLPYFISNLVGVICFEILFGNSLLCVLVSFVMSSGALDWSFYKGLLKFPKLRKKFLIIPSLGLSL